MTEIRTFRASSMQEALDLVRQEMGPEAVILHTRQLEGRRLLPWFKPRREVEITAGMGFNVRTRRSQRSAASVGSRLNGAPAEPAQPAPRNQPSKGQGGTVPQTPAAPSASHGAAARSVDSTPNTGTGPSAEDAMRQRVTSTAETSGGNPSYPAAANETESAATAAIAERLDSIQQMLKRLGQMHHAGGEEIPEYLFDLYTDLIDAEVEEDLARELVFRLRRNHSPEELANREHVRSLLTGLIEAEICCADPITPRAGVRKVVALIGPTGVGKTTTIAKLAANFRLRDGVKMGLVTVDTYRIAAVEQLRTYAQIIDLPMKVVTSPPEMRRALDELTGMDLVMIDTAGRSPRDELKIQELKSLLTDAGVDEVHLVLSLTSSARSLQATAERFAPASPTAVVFTKLDEAVGVGQLLSAVRRVGLPVSYLTTGQDVPDDIEPAHAGRMARLILGLDRLFD